MFDLWVNIKVTERGRNNSVPSLTHSHTHTFDHKITYSAVNNSSSNPLASNGSESASGGIEKRRNLDFLRSADAVVVVVEGVSNVDELCIEWEPFTIAVVAQRTALCFPFSFADALGADALLDCGTSEMEEEEEAEGGDNDDGDEDVDDDDDNDDDDFAESDFADGKVDLIGQTMSMRIWNKL